MNKTVWRIATDTKTHEADDLSGAGPKTTGGRWNEPGLPVIYTSENQSLACLETLVHLNAFGLPFNRYLVAITIPSAVWSKAQTATPATRPVGWDAEPAARASIQFGTSWLKSTSSALLKVPSVIVPAEFNILLNPLHPDSRAITAEKLRRWLYDPRLTS